MGQFGKAWHGPGSTGKSLEHRIERKQKNMTARKIVYRLLFQALADIRESSYHHAPHRDKAAYHLADLFHNVVLQLEAIAEGSQRLDYDDVLNFIKERSREKGWQKWVDDQIATLAVRNGEPAGVA
jgi:hypothetical protein